MAFRFAVKTGENELTSCAAVLGTLGGLGLLPPTAKASKTKAFRPTKGAVWGVRGKDRYLVGRHFSGIWKCAGDLRPGGLGTRFRRPRAAPWARIPPRPYLSHGVRRLSEARRRLIGSYPNRATGGPRAVPCWQFWQWVSGAPSIFRGRGVTAAS